MSSESYPGTRDVAQSTPSAPFRWPVRIYYEDTDAGGVVYYANYLNFFERARTEWLRSLGFAQDTLRSRHGVIFVVRKVSINYWSPARLDDRLTVLARVAHCGRVGLDFEQEIRRDTDGRRCTSALVSVACVRVGDWRPARIPAELLERIGQ